MKTPLFVVGKHRSGTTWLSNLLLDHSQIAGVQHRGHHGIHESAFFSHVHGRYGDLSVFSNFAEFASVLSQSDYCRLMEVSFGDIVQLYPSTYAGVFRTIMDRFAEKHGAHYWIEKSPMHTSRIREIGKMYPDAQFVGILRNPVDAAFSWLKRQAVGESVSRRLTELGRFTLNKCILDAHMWEMQKEWPKRVCIVRYEELIEDRDGVIESVCTFLGLPFAEIRAQYAANTSYEEDESERHRPRYEKKFVKWLYRCGMCTAPAKGGRYLKHALQERRTSLPDWFFKLSR